MDGKGAISKESMTFKCRVILTKALGSSVTGYAQWTLILMIHNTVIYPTKKTGRSEEAKGNVWLLCDRVRTLRACCWFIELLKVLRASGS